MNLESHSHPVICVDGPAGSGKSTICRKLAEALHIVHADSGAIYRTLTLALMERLGPGNSPEEFGAELKKKGFDYSDLGVSISVVEGKQRNQIQNRDVGDEIRTREVTGRIRYIADDPRARAQVNQLLKDFSRTGALIVDGRDIGTVVFPGSPFKFFLVASPSVRAKRRFDEMKQKGETPPPLDQLEAEILKRDGEDEKRPEGALRMAPDAILIDTSDLDVEGVVKRVAGYLQIEF